MLTAVLSACSLTAMLGALLNVLPDYRNALGVVTTAQDLVFRSTPGVACGAIHAACALRVRVGPPTKSHAVWLCGLFDIVVGASMWVPFGGAFIALLSPFSFVFFVAGYIPTKTLFVGITAYVATSLATLSVGVYILRQSRRVQLIGRGTFPVGKS
jgi:hypothetical protein